MSLDVASAGALAQRRPGSDHAFAIILTAVFLAIVGPVVLHHEMWRDEVQAWLLARDTSLSGLFHALHYEGHPSLWYLILRMVTPFSESVRNVQAISLGFGAASVYLFALRAPLPRIVRVLFAFGYFVAYGYTVVARSYSVEMFLIMLICILATGHVSRRSSVLLGSALLLLANTSVYGVILVLAFAGTMLILAVLGVPDTTHAVGHQDATQRQTNSSIGRRLRPVAVPVGLAILGTCLAVAQIWPRSDAAYVGNGVITRVASGLPRRPISLAYRLTPMWRAFAPIPPMDHLGDMWEGDMLLSRSPRAEPVAAVLSVSIVLILLAVLGRSPFAAMFFGLATLGILLFSLLIYAGSLYHHGHFFLAFVMGLWIGAADSRWQHPGSGESRIMSLIARQRVAIVCLVLFVQVVGAVIRLVADYRQPFSEGEAVATYINAHLAAGTIVASEPGFNGTTVSGYLGRPVYQLDRQRFATFTPLWVRWPATPDSQLVQRVRECCVRGGEPAVLLLGHLLGHTSAAPQLVAKFVTSIQPSERYFLYVVGPSAVPGGAR